MTLWYNGEVMCSRRECCILSNVLKPQLHQQIYSCRNTRYDPTSAWAQLGRNPKQIVTKLISKSIIKLQIKNTLQNNQKESKLQTIHTTKNTLKYKGVKKTNKNTFSHKLKPTGLNKASSQKKDFTVSYTAEASGFMPLTRWAKLHIITN